MGIDTSDDAAVYKINNDLAIIQTLDFFTPIVDDPYLFGQIAATNSLSDIYAMGGSPILALNIVCFPTCLDFKILGDILKGGADKVREAGATIVGGHTIDDKEPKYGLSVTGLVHPDKVLKNSNAKPGDILILTKPLGTGIINTAIKGEIAEKSQIEMAVRSMTTLNKYAYEVALDFNINACTDITGFGLMGHALEMAEGSKVSIVIERDKIKYFDGVDDLAKMGIIPAGTYKNKEYLEGKYDFNNLEDYMLDILMDPQTSGGLLYSISEKEGNKFIYKLKENGIEANIIGYVQEKGEKYLYIK
ncbi:hypothetical protein Q428_07830 [Fervidicella metallireducens AeB]|uniref:Selenide, water dikinase n=1 Tax=Fervidicella metallireducens AeB TaxID=1403537 RepID=A0A017RVR7_9CLOT|nr:hypothetical protein Q428_07830 [Fervidicella metallireducens AeB]